MIYEETHPGVFQSIQASPRALVLLTVPWSVYPLVTLQNLRKAVARLDEIGLSVEAFVVDEESDLTQSWLQSFQAPWPYGNGVALGWGSVLWLEHGRLVEFIGHAIDERVIGLLGRTKSRWMS